MPIRVEVRGHGIVEFPDGTPQPEMQVALERLSTPATPPPAQPPPVAASPGFPHTSNDPENMAGWQDVAKGAAKSVLGTAQGVGRLLGVEGPLMGLNSQPSNYRQSVGKTAGNVAQFFAPSGVLSKAKAALATGTGVLDALVGAGLESASAAGVQAAQQGSSEGVGRTAALTAATGAGLFGASKALGWMGERIERALLKPSVAASEGLTPAQLAKNVFKYDVGGTLGQSYDKVQTKLSNLSSQLKTVLAKKGSPLVDFSEVYNDTLKSYAGNQQAEQALKRVEEAIKFGLNRRGIAVNSSHLDLYEANVAKQAVGEMGAWLHDPHGKVISDADRITEDVANRFYSTLKAKIEQNAQGPVKQLNAMMSDLIPIKTAIIRRIPIEQRANVMDLGDLLGLSSHTLGISVANRLLKSGMTANVMSKVAQKAEPIAARAARGVAATSAAVPTQ